MLVMNIICINYVIHSILLYFLPLVNTINQVKKRTLWPCFTFSPRLNWWHRPHFKTVLTVLIFCTTGLNAFVKHSRNRIFCTFAATSEFNLLFSNRSSFVLSILSFRWSSLHHVTNFLPSYLTGAQRHSTTNNKSNIKIELVFI